MIFRGPDGSSRDCIKEPSQEEVVVGDHLEGLVRRRALLSCFLECHEPLPYGVVGVIGDVLEYGEEGALDGVHAHVRPVP